MKTPIEIYTAPDGSTTVEVRFEGETFWLNLSQIADLFEKDKSVISRHLKNIFDVQELDRAAVVAKMQQLRQTVKPMKSISTISMRSYPSATG